MLTCLEIVNILYYKCVDLCYEIKYKYNRVFNDNRHRPRQFNYNSIFCLLTNCLRHKNRKN